MRKLTIFVTSASVLILLLIYVLDKYYIIKPRVGSPLPPITFINQNNKSQKIQNSRKTTVIMILSTKCRFCQYQLNILKHHAESFFGYNMYLLSIDPLSHLKYDSKLWSDLSCNSNIYVGKVENTDVMRYFGSVKIPSVFFYDEYNKLYAIRSGAIEWKELQKIINRNIKYPEIN